MAWANLPGSCGSDICETLKRIMRCADCDRLNTLPGASTPREIGPIFNDNLRRYAANRPLRHQVNRTLGY